MKKLLFVGLLFLGTLLPILLLAQVVPNLGGSGSSGISDTFCVNSSSADTCLARGASAGFLRLSSTTNSTSNAFAVKNGANAEAGGVAWDGANSLIIGTQGGVNGGTARATIFGSATTITLATNNGTAVFNIPTNGDLSIGSDAGAIIYGKATPTIASGFGTSPTIAGRTSAFRVTVGIGGATTGTVTLGRTFTNIPICQANDEVTANYLQTTPTTTTVVVNGTMVAADTISVVCIGY
jgi:hypothetical protein